ncbi:MAG: ATP-binding protein, partial [Bacteroidota bacterium]
MIVKSLRYKIILGFISFSILLLAVFIPSNIYYFNRKDKIGQVVNELNLIYRDLLKEFGNSESFFQYELTNPSFFISKSSVYIDDHLSFKKSITSKLNRLNETARNSGFWVTPYIDTIQTAVEQYNQSFKQLVNLAYERGYKDFGVEGQMRDYIHKLENIKGVNQTNVLSLRRHEKDYIIRNEQGYIDKLNLLSKVFSAEVAGSANLSQTQKESVNVVIKNYTALFNKMVELDRLMGLKDNSGLKKSFIQNKNYIERSFQDLINTADTQKTQLIHALEFYYVIISVVLLILSAIISLIMIQRLTKPLKKLTNYINCLIKNDFKVFGTLNVAKADLEVQMIYNEFNNMVNQLQQREEQRDNALAAMKESEAKFRELADMLPQSIFETDANGYFTYVNNTWLRTFGYNRTDLEERLNIAEILVSSNAMQLFDRERIESVEFRAIKKSCKDFPALVYSNKIVRNGETIGARGIIIDITERRKYIEALKREKSKAEESDRLKSAFLANMSHEIRTPMNAILGFADLLSDNSLTGQQQKEFIAHIKSSGQQLMNIIDDIIDIAKIEAGEVKIQNSPCFINEMIQETIVSHREILKRQNKEDVELTAFLFRKDAFTIDTDPFRLRQILDNLISNAIKFTEKGSIDVGYRFDHTDKITFFVRDTGIGIAQEKHDIIFERFRQIDETSNRNYGGTGLGLSITRNLVELLGGKIWVESMPEKGSCFCFYLPYNGTGKPIESSKKMVYKEKSIFEWYGKTILVVEDEPSNYNVLEAYLKESMASLIWAKDGQEALDICRNNKTIDLVLMDIQMPRMNGYEATPVLKKEFPNLPVIAQTAYAMSEEKIKCQKAGCDDYISKPVEKN